MSLHPDDKGWMGVYDVYVDQQDRVVLLYLGDKDGLNNVRRAVSTDQGWTFTFQRGDVLGDAADARARGANAAFVDQKSTLLHDGRTAAVRHAARVCDLQLRQRRRRRL